MLYSRLEDNMFRLDVTNEMGTDVQLRVATMRCDLASIA